MTYVKIDERRRQLVLAARAVLARDGVKGTTLRAVSAEAGVLLGTLQYVFPSKEQILTAVIEDVRDEISGILKAAGETDAGLDQAIRHGLKAYWQHVVVSDPGLPLMQHELFIYAVRTPALSHLARMQVSGYQRIVAEWCQQAANNAGEVCDVPFGTLARVLVGSVMGLVLQHLSDEDQARSQEDLDAVIEMLIRLAAVRPASSGAGKQ